MRVCKQCGVELDEGMKTCPLCGLTDGSVPPENIRQAPAQHGPDARKRVMQRVLWQITAALLVSGVLATFVINLAINGEITWSIYPISICLMILAYVSLMAFLKTTLVFQLIGGWVISSLLLAIIYRVFRTEWPLSLAFPILSAVNIIAIIFYFIVKKLRTIGLNVIAGVFVAVAVLCLAVEAIVSHYFHNVVKLGWSVIVTACLLPVTTAILFMYFRTRDNPELKKIFHT